MFFLFFLNKGLYLNPPFVAKRGKSNFINVKKQDINVMWGDIKIIPFLVPAGDSKFSGRNLNHLPNHAGET